MKIMDVLELYEMSLYNKNLAPRTIKLYIRELKVFEEFMSDSGIMEVSQIKPIYLEKFNTFLIKRGNAPTTRARKKSILDSFFDYCKKQELIPKNPAETMNSIKITDVDREKREALTYKETIKLLDCVNKYSQNKERNTALLKILAFCGIRVNELINLKWEDIDTERKVITVEGKGRKKRNVPLFKDIEKDLLEYKKKIAKGKGKLPEYVFFSKRTGGPLTERAVHDLVKRYSKKARIKKNIGPHSLRRTAATNYLREGINVRYIQLLLGHSNMSTTSRYMNPDEEEVNKSLAGAFESMKKKNK